MNLKQAWVLKETFYTFEILTKGILHKTAFKTR